MKPWFSWIIGCGLAAGLFFGFVQAQDWSPETKYTAPYMEMAKGNVDAHSTLNKFGRNPEIDTATDPEDVWDGGGVWVAPTQARIHDIASTDVADDAGSTGCLTLRLYGLTDWDTAEASEDVTMDGTTNVATAASYVIVHRMKCMTFGSGGINAGTITATAQTDATVTAQITIGKGQTLMAIYGIPSIQNLYLTGYYVGMNRVQTSAANVDIDMFVNERADQSDSGFLVKHHLGLGSTGASHIPHMFDPPFTVAGPSIIKLQVENVSANGTDISAGFDGILVGK